MDSPENFFLKQNNLVLKFYPTWQTQCLNEINQLNDPGFDPNYNSIIVLEKNTIIAGIPNDKIEAIRHILDGYAQQRKGRNWAVVVPNKRLEVFLKLNLELIGPVKFNIRIFLREDEALTWIKDR